MHCLVLDKLTTKQCIVSAVCTPAKECHKDKFWEHLKRLHDVINKPWCIIGQL